MVYCSVINLLWSLMSKLSTTFRPVIYGPCSRTGVTCVASDFRQRAPTMNSDQGYHLPAIYNQIIPPKSEATRDTST